MTEAPDVYPDGPEGEEPGEPDDSGVEGALEVGGEAAAARTGLDRVDAVLDSLVGLDERPVTEHAAVFERAHEELRAALEPDRESA